VDQDVNDLHINLSDIMDRSKWRVIIRGNWSDSNSDSDAESSILIVCFWSRLNTQVNVD